jgi:hypothetical protein
MTEAEQLQEHLNRLRTGWPLVTLTHGQAVAQAKRLRIRGMSYSGISHAMAAYHGYYLSAGAWQRRLRRLGIPASKGPNAMVRF